MTTKRFFTYYTISILLVSIVFCIGCSNDDKNTIVDNDTNNHTIVLQNGGSNTVECTARQFTRIELIPTQNPASTISKTFVSNPNSTIDIEMTIPETGTYKITFFVADIDSCIWWDSIALELYGTTNATLSTHNVGFNDNSYVASIRSSGNNIPCN
ncbi:MAG: hypothetical protein MUO58_19585 [Anaerolineales bacterium]|nr:hypothetical protein [Anaerolineales bacterium]